MFGHDQLGNLLLILSVERDQLFIYRFEFFVATLQFFIPGEQFLVAGLKFFMCGLVVLGRHLQFYLRALQVILQIGDASDGFAGRIELVTLGRGGRPLRFLKEDEHHAGLAGFRDQGLDFEIDNLIRVLPGTDTAP